VSGADLAELAVSDHAGPSDDGFLWEVAVRLRRMIEGMVTGPFKDLVELAKDHFGHTYAKWLARLFVVTGTLGCTVALVTIVSYGVHGIVGPLARWVGFLGTIPAPPLPTDILLGDDFGVLKPCNLTRFQQILFFAGLGSVTVLGSAFFVYFFISERRMYTRWKANNAR
jgi:hypothetical protein